MAETIVIEVPTSSVLIEYLPSNLTRAFSISIEGDDQVEIIAESVGLAGPQGDSGAQGAQGAQGIQGVPGVAGDDLPDFSLIFENQLI